MSKGGSRNSALDEQMEECRALLADVRGATKDLNAAIKAAKAAFPELAEEKMQEAAKVEIDRLSELTTAHVKRSEERIMARFDKIANLLITGSTDGKPRKGGHNLEETLVTMTENNGGPLRPEAKLWEVSGS